MGLIAALLTSQGCWGEEIRSGRRTGLGKCNEVQSLGTACHNLLLFSAGPPVHHAVQRWKRCRGVHVGVQGVGGEAESEGPSLRPPWGAESPRLVTKGRPHLSHPLSTCCLHHKSFAGLGFPALTCSSTGRWPHQGAVRDGQRRPGQAFSPSSLEALTGGKGEMWEHRERRLLCPHPSSFFLTFSFVKGQAPSASLMGIKVLLLCDCLPCEGCAAVQGTCYPPKVWVGVGAPTSPWVCGDTSPQGPQLPFPRCPQAPECFLTFWAEANSLAH